MRTKLINMRKLDKNNTEVELEYDDGYVAKQIFVKYDKAEIFEALRKTCNCTISKQFA